LLGVLATAIVVAVRRVFLRRRDDRESDNGSGKP